MSANPQTPPLIDEREPGLVSRAAFTVILAAFCAIEIALFLVLHVGLRWPLDIFPHAWFWQEVHGLPGYPWFRRAYVVAVEPNTTVPAQGLTAAREKGGSGISLAGGERREVTIEAIAYRGDHDLESLDKGGAALFQHSRR